MNAKTATRIEDVLGALSAIEAEESELSHSLAAIVTDRERTQKALVRLERLVPALDRLIQRGEGLSGNVAKTAATAERVGAGVRNLERLMGRVRAAAERVGQVSDAKASLAALHAAIDQRDWETAARHCTRDLPNPPSQTLDEARASLLAVFRKEFDAAAIARDPVAISRFFKLFPAINCPADGLAAYSDFVLDLVSRRAPPSVKTSSPQYYTAALTALYESVAGLIDQHQPIVEKYYGSGNMHTVVARILRECDRVVTGLYDGWEEERDIPRKLTDTRTATFQTLVPSSRGKPNIPDDSSPDPREIDRVLGELATMSGRWALFRRFIVNRIEDDLTPSAPPTPETPAAALKPTTPGPTTPGFGLKPITPALSPIHTTLSKDPADAKDPTKSDLDDPHQRALTLVAETGSHTRLHTLLDSTYAPLETWHLRAALDRAHVNSSPSNPQNSTNPTSTAQTSTTPDDAFFIIHLTLTRALTSGSVVCVKKTVKTVKDVVERDLVGVIRRRMEDCWRTGSSPAVGVKGKGAGEDKVSVYVTYLNDLSICAHHADRLARELSTSPTFAQGFLEDEVEEARTAVAGLNELGGFRGVVKTGIDNLFTQLVKPRLRSLIPEIYRDVTYVLDDAGYSSAEHDDAVRKRFVRGWGEVVGTYKNTLTEENYRTFFALAVEVIVRPWEKYIMGMKFTELGAIRFDRDLRAIIAHLAVGDARDKFARLQQVSTLLNLDAEEDPDEFYTSSGIAWKLSASEARAVSALRV
ncbi:COG4 transport domain-containing protein [Ceratobasidium sp. AG-Ba]|nr:COG4 transport domain-containing protein [Ceratobasidium sp. AG-Ba]